MPVEINTAAIPEYARFDLLAAAHEATEEFFRQPGVEERFQKWKAERDACRKTESGKGG